jgi:ADP-heptose:LPS heptosyltransferase
MQFRFIRLLDQIIGKFLLLALNPLCGLIAHFLPSPVKETPQTIAILKLHGGGSLLIALPALLGIRTKYPQAVLTLIGTGETEKYAELTGVFDRTLLIDSGSLPVLLISGVKALAASFGQDVVIDLEPHSSLAAVFCPLTFAARRIGFVKAHEPYRARSYTDALYFNLHAPIHIFYEQVTALLKASPASIEACRTALKTQSDGNQQLLKPEHAKPVLYISPFASSLSTERMLPAEIWIEQLQKKFGTARFTLIVGGGMNEIELSRGFAARIGAALPSAQVVNACGRRSLCQTAADIGGADEFWGIDSGPLHLARLLGKKCTSFWGPTNPAFLLGAIPGLEEQVFYRSFPCSPCVHVSATSPCKSDNQCMKLLFKPEIPAPFIRL